MYNIVIRRKKVILWKHFQSVKVYASNFGGFEFVCATEPRIPMVPTQNNLLVVRCVLWVRAHMGCDHHLRPKSLFQVCVKGITVRSLFPFSKTRDVCSRKFFFEVDGKKAGGLCQEKIEPLPPHCVCSKFMGRYRLKMGIHGQHNLLGPFSPHQLLTFTNSNYIPYPVGII